MHVQTYNTSCNYHVQIHLYLKQKSLYSIVLVNLMPDSRFRKQFCHCC